MASMMLQTGFATNKHFLQDKTPLYTNRTGSVLLTVQELCRAPDERLVLCPQQLHIRPRADSDP